MGNIIWYKHHGVAVAVDEDLKGKHRDHCLCYRCANFYPGEPVNCDLAEQNFLACSINSMAMPVFECSEFDAKEQ